MSLFEHGIELTQISKKSVDVITLRCYLSVTTRETYEFNGLALSKTATTALTTSWMQAMKLW
jgi:hypothetical protein